MTKKASAGNKSLTTAALPVPRIVRASLYEQVASNIEDWIISRALKPGDRLPSERELCEQFGLSRTVIREAIKTLAERGLVSIQPGRGNFVARLSAENLSEAVNRFLRFSNETYEDLLEMRELLEVKIAELAAVRARPEDCRRLEAAVKAMDEAQNDADLFLAGDLAFHSALARATQSGVFMALVNSIVDYLYDIRLVGFQVNAYKRGWAEHRRIYQAICDKNPATAREAMRQHLQNVRKDIETAMKTASAGRNLQ
jgi:GntR family transcriptional repressor for pyruvate dehydrogenase complex